MANHADGEGAQPQRARRAGARAWRAAFWCSLVVTTAAMGAFGQWGLPHASGSHAASVTSAEAMYQLLMVVLIGVLWLVSFSYRDRREAPAEGDDVTPPFAAKSSGPWAGAFVAFRRHVRRWWPVLLTLLPALMFVMAMKDQYNTAVFVMALGAIFVAIEHLTSLKHTESEMHDIRGALQPGELAAARDMIYSAYSRADQRIDAVLRLFDIDDGWQIEHQRRGGVNLYTALTHLEPGQTARSDKVVFVGHVERHLFDKGLGSETAPPEFFEALLGIAWRVWILGHVDEARSTPGSLDAAESEALRNLKLIEVPFVRMRIANSPVWMHAVDERVFVIDEDPRASRSRVREPNADLESDSLKRRVHADWAHEEIRRYARRGTDAVEYVMAVLRYGLLARYTEDVPIRRDELAATLNTLGMRRWVESRERGEREATCTLTADDCVDVFMAFIDQRTAGHVPTPGSVRVVDLLHDLL